MVFVDAVVAAAVDWAEAAAFGIREEEEGGQEQTAVVPAGSADREEEEAGKLELVQHEEEVEVEFLHRLDWEEEEVLQAKVIAGHN